MKITFVADRNPKAKQAQIACIKKYGQADLCKTDVVVVLGGDGFMLKTLQALLNYQIPVFGLNLGHVGFLLNHYRADDLPERIQKAHKISVKPLSVYAETVQGKSIQAHVFNEVALMRQSPQAARLDAIIQDDKKNMTISKDTVFGDGLIVATPVGSHGYYSSAGGQPIPMQAHSIGVRGVCCRQAFGRVISDNLQIRIMPQERKKRPIHMDCDGKMRYRNIAQATIQSEPEKAQVLLLENKKNSR